MTALAVKHIFVLIFNSFKNSVLQKYP